MAEDLGTAYVNIVPKAPGIENNIETLLGGGDGQSGAEKAGTGLGKKLISGLAKSGVVIAAGKLVKSAFEAGGALEQSFGGLDTIYGDASAAAKQYAMDAALAGISANDYAEQAVSFGAALKAAYGGDTAAAAEAANKAILDMADNAAKMGTPLESLQNAYQGFAKGNYTMLDNLKLGYGGTEKEMKRLLADAQKISGVKYDITNLGDVYSAIHVIQGELGLTGVAASEAGTTLTGSLASVKASWENVMAALTTGEGLETAMDNFGTSITNFGENALRMFSILIPQIPALVGGLAESIIANSPQLIKSGIEMLIQLAVGLIAGIPQIIQQIPEIFAAAKSAFMEADWSGIGGDIITGIISGLRSWAGAIWDEMRSLASSAWQAAKDALGIGSPSKVFAQQVGRWIPAGVAVGIDENAETVDTAVASMVDPSALRMPANVVPFAQSQSTGTDELETILAAISRLGFDLYLDGKQITDCVTVRQRRMQRSGGVA